MKVIALIGEGNAGITRNNTYAVVEDMGAGGVMVVDDDGENHLLSVENCTKVEDSPRNAHVSHDMTKQLADALHAILNDGGPAAMGAGYEALAIYSAQTKSVHDMTDDELLAELAKPAKRYTVESQDLKGSGLHWGVANAQSDGLVTYFGSGIKGKRRAIAVAHALNGLES